MPRIPILPPPADVSGGAGTGDGPETLPPEAAAGLRRLEARTARIDEGLAVSQGWLSAVDRLAQAADAPEGPSPGFTRSFLEQTDRDRQAAVDGLPPNRRVGLDQALLGLRADFAGRAAAVEADGLALRRRLGLYRMLDGYRAGVTKDPGLYDDAAGRMAGLVASLELPEDRRQALDEHVKDALGNAAVDGLMQEPVRAERMLSAGLFDDALSQASKATRLKQAQDLVARQSLLDRERTLSDLTAQADAGTALDATIGAAQKSGVVTNAEADQLRSRNTDAAQAAARREANVRRVASSSEPLDPARPDDQAAVSDYWDQVSGAYAHDDAATQRKAEQGFVQRTGVLPDGLRRKYQGALLSADPAVAVSGAQAIDALVQQDPVLVSDIPADQRQRAQAIARYAALDLPPHRAVQLAEKDVEENAASGDGPQTSSSAKSDQTLADEPVDERLRRDSLAPVPRVGAADNTAGDRTASPLARFVAIQRNEILAAQQWTSPDTSRYEKLGRYVETDGGGMYVDAAGRWVPVDLRRHAVLIDPDSGKVSVYRRSSKTDENRLVSFGRLLSAGLITGPLGVAGGAALRARQALEGAGREAAMTFATGIGPAERGAAETIAGAAKGEAWAVEKAVPGAGKGAGQVQKVIKPGKAAYPKEETTLYMTQREPVAADAVKTGRPLGLTDDATFAAFKTILREEKAKLPSDTRFAIRGSAVTGNGFEGATGTYTKDYFDVGRQSDHDIAIVSRTLFDKARQVGVKLRQGGTRTDVLSKNEMANLGLMNVLQRVRDLTDRKKTGLMIYKSVDALNKRGTNIQFDLK